ncbi:hypothetical protein ACLK2C_17065 [Escherichia coli]
MELLINVLIELFQPFPFNLQNFFSRLQEIEIWLQIYLRHSDYPDSFDEKRRAPVEQCQPYNKPADEQ